MLIRETRFRRNLVHLFRDNARHGGDAGEGELFPAIEQGGVALHRGIQRRARPVAARLGVERGKAGRTPTANPTVLRLAPRRAGRMARDAQVVVDPHATRLERSIQARHLAHVVEKARLARTVAGLAFKPAATSEAAPGLAVYAFDERYVVRMAERRLELQARHDAYGAQFVRIPRQTLYVRRVPCHLRESDARGEPHFVAGGTILAQRLERLGPLRVVRRVRSAKANHHEWWFVSGKGAERDNTCEDRRNKIGCTFFHGIMGIR